MHSLESHIPVERKCMKQQSLQHCLNLLDSFSIFPVYFGCEILVQESESLTGRIWDKDLYILLNGWQSTSLPISQPHN